MFKILFYREPNGRSPVEEYMHELYSKLTDKDSRIRYAKIMYAIEYLERNGTMLESPLVKHLTNGLWELRPSRTRIFFTFSSDFDAYVLLHAFTKKTLKTPKSELQRAERELQDLETRGAGNVR